MVTHMRDNNTSAFLAMIAWAELGPELLAASDRGYNVIVGSTPLFPKLFHSYHDHPRITVELRDKKGNVIGRSSAAGRYQILKRIFDSYKTRLELPDFSPASQDKIAMQLIRECKAIEDINNGNIEQAIVKVKSRWASMPGAGYGQTEKKMAELIRAYKSAGGTTNNTARA
jgi:muramidase (phage lysozyme)